MHLTYVAVRENDLKAAQLYAEYYSNLLNHHQQTFACDYQLLGYIYYDYIFMVILYLFILLRRS